MYALVYLFSMFIIYGGELLLCACVMCVVAVMFGDPPVSPFDDPRPA
jgi:hypothetical protein